MKLTQKLNTIHLIFLFTLIAVGCTSGSSKPIKRFETIQPTHKTNNRLNSTKTDTLRAYLSRYTMDSVGFTFDSIQVEGSAHFLDRFTDAKKPRFSHFRLFDASEQTFIGEWKFKDSSARKNALFNWLDHFGPQEKQIEWYGKKKISSENTLILVNKTSIIQVNSTERIATKKWQKYQKYYFPKDTTILIIEQIQGKPCQWSKPKYPIK
jgi:hypothetical protein